MKEKDFEWVMKIIKSCETDFHFEGIDVLIELFNKKHQDKLKVTELISAKQNKWFEVNTIIH